MPRSRSKNKKKKPRAEQRAGEKLRAKKSARRHFQSKSRRYAQESRTKQSVGALFEELVAVQARLRAPGGCPWDREQTHLTLRTYLIEEAYEVLAAIEASSAPELSEELGDLLLQVLFHADLAKEAGTFDIANVITGIRDKMIRRHPHVFGNVTAKNSAEVLKNWAKLKAQEKSEKGILNSAAPSSALEGVSPKLPALLEAYQLTRKAAQVGFDWKEVEGIFEKIQEEILEIRAALQTGGSSEIESEAGDLLFSFVNLARFLKIDPEAALKRSNAKFKARFFEMERRSRRNGQALSELSAEELEALWARAKAAEAARPVPGQGGPS